jgi:glycosyltransferase involved in cell wall biosynthesis
MNVFLVNQFYPPDLAPTGLLLRDAARALAERGHAVTVICSGQTYARGQAQEDLDSPRIRVVRMGGSGEARPGGGGTLARQLRFHLSVYSRIASVRPSPDVVVAMTSPPLIGVTLQWACGTHATAHVQWLMDLYPDVLAAAGSLRDEGPIYRFLNRLTRRQWRECAAIVSPGPGMTGRVAARLGKGARTSLVTIPLWAPGDLRPWPEGEANPLRAARGWGEDDVVFLYSGNLGRGHTATPFVRVAEDYKSIAGLRWGFAGEARRLAGVAHFAQQHREARISCMPYASEADLRAHLCSADVHLASLRASWTDLIMPSKLQAAFAVGRPVLFVGPVQSDPARWIVESGGGWVAGRDDSAAVRRAVMACCDPEERRRRGMAARRYAEAHFDRARNCERLAEVVEEAGRSSAVAGGRT